MLLSIVQMLISSEVCYNFIKLASLTTHDYKDFHGLTPAQAAHRAYSAFIHIFTSSFGVQLADAS